MKNRIFLATPEPGNLWAYRITASLPDCIMCQIRCEYNTGVYQLDMQYVPGGDYANMLVPGNAIICSTPFSASPQTFRIQSIRRALTDVISVTAYHISYLHGSEICAPFLNGGQAWTASQAWAAGIDAIKNQVGGTKLCTVSDSATFGIHLLQPASFRSLIYDQLLPTYGGVVTYNNLNITWSDEDNTDRGVTLMGGVNVIGCAVESIAGFETGIYPYYGTMGSDSGGYVDLGTPIMYGIDAPHNIIPMSFNDRFETTPTTEQLKSAAEKYALTRASEYHPIAVTIDQVPDAAIIIPGDTVHIVVRQLSVRTDRIVTAVVYDAVRGVIASVEVGPQERNSLAKILAGGR